MTAKYIRGLPDFEPRCSCGEPVPSTVALDGDDYVEELDGSMIYKECCGGECPKCGKYYEWQRRYKFVETINFVQVEY